MSRVLLSSILLLLTMAVRAQTRLEYEEVDALPRASRHLLSSPSLIKGDHVATESVLDLAQPWLLDSTISKPKQRHISFWGWGLDNFFGLNWKALNTSKQKYIGSSSRTMQVFDGVAREVDINLFVMPHLPHYAGMVKNVYLRTIEQNNGSTKQFRIDTPPYDSPEELRFEDKGYYTVECEVTPADVIREKFNATVMPIETGDNPLRDHPNFGMEYPSFGMMGVLCLDCNHNCRPEIHPIESLWWLDMAQDSTKPASWEWMFTLLHDDTRRFEDWSPAPIEGRIAIPFRIPYNASELNIRIEPLIIEGADSLRQNLPSDHHPLQLGKSEFQIDRGPKLVVAVEGQAAAPQSAWWFGKIKRHRDTGDFFGYIYVASASKHGFAARIQTTIQP